ncbi:MAG: hypothetical protein H6815_02080 [Phycisphaeraceae bacterium]|nr:hypothetical protein [Phycisphaerales bacterium]MCB9859216.1 hypothetical protein [Phycisphaeraceae bacterium]
MKGVCSMIGALFALLGPVILDFESGCATAPAGWNVTGGTLMCTAHSPSSAGTFGALGTGLTTFVATNAATTSASVIVAHPVSPTGVEADISVSNSGSLPIGTLATYTFVGTNGNITLTLNGTSSSSYEAVWASGGSFWTWPTFTPGRFYRHTLCIENSNTSNDVLATAVMVDEYDPSTGAVLNSVTQQITPPFVIPGYTRFDEFVAISIDKPSPSPATAIDNIVIEEKACYPDCDGSGSLDLFDYICFGNAYAMQDPYADCDGSGQLNIFDYICFGNAYAAGCP